PLEPTDLVMRRLDETTQCLVASPALIRTPLSSPSELSGLPSLYTGSAHRAHQWQLNHKDGPTALIPHRPPPLTHHTAAPPRAAPASSPTTSRCCARRRWPASASCSFRLSWSGKISAPGVLSMSCRNGSRAAASSMQCSPRGGACSPPSALCSTFSLRSAPPG